MSDQETAFATGVPPDIYEFHLYTWNSVSLSCTPVTAVSDAVLRLSRRISHLTYRTTYAPFTPSNSEQRLHPPYYRGCWHGVSRCFLRWYRQNPAIIYRGTLLPTRQGFTTRRPSSPTRRRWVRLSPIAQYSPLLPPVGVWAVSQSQCGWSSSQTSYPS